MTTAQDIWSAPTAAHDAVRPAARPRLRGLRFPALPSWPLLAQGGGGIAALVGVYQEWGSAGALMAGGVAAVVVGMLREAGRV